MAPRKMPKMISLPLMALPFPRKYWWVVILALSALILLGMYIFRQKSLMEGFTETKEANVTNTTAGNLLTTFSMTLFDESGNKEWQVKKGSSYNGKDYSKQTPKNICNDISGCGGFVLNIQQQNSKYAKAGQAGTVSFYKTMSPVQQNAGKQYQMYVK